MSKPIRVLTSHTAHASYLASLRHKPSGDVLYVAGYLPRYKAPAIDRFHYSPVCTVYRTDAGAKSKCVVIVETRHKRYEVWEVDPSAVIGEQEAEEAHIAYVKRAYRL